MGRSGRIQGTKNNPLKNEKELAQKRKKLSGNQLDMDLIAPRKWPRMKTHFDRLWEGCWGVLTGVKAYCDLIWGGEHQDMPTGAKETAKLFVKEAFDNLGLKPGLILKNTLPKISVKRWWRRPKKKRPTFRPISNTALLQITLRKKDRPESLIFAAR